MLSDSMRVGLSAGAAMPSFSLRSVCDECAQKLYRYWGEESLIPSPTTESARSQEENCSLYFVPITTLKNVGGRGCNSLLRNPELLSIRCSSLNVYASPAVVPASMIRLKLAANGGVTRTSVGTNSTIAARPPGLHDVYTHPHSDSP